MNSELHAQIIRELFKVHPYALKRPDLSDRHGGRQVAPALRSLANRGLVELSSDQVYVWLEYPVAEALKLFELIEEE